MGNNYYKQYGQVRRACFKWGISLCRQVVVSSLRLAKIAPPWKTWTLHTSTAIRTRKPTQSRSRANFQTMPKACTQLLQCFRILRPLEKTRFKRLARWPPQTKTNMTFNKSSFTRGNFKLAFGSLSKRRRKATK